MFLRLPLITLCDQPQLVLDEAFSVSMPFDSMTDKEPYRGCFTT